MPVPSSRRLSLLLPVALACVASAAGAQTPPSRPLPPDVDARTSFARPESNRQQIRDSMTDSVRRIERSTRGRVLSIEQMHSEGRDLNRVKVMDDEGRVRIFVDDPAQRGRPQVRARRDDD
ncbi:MAG: hypothetical protein ABW163_11090 [Luteimonas sp.]